MRWYGTTRRGQDVTIKFLRVRSLRQDRGNTYKHQTKSPRGDEPRYYLCNVLAYEYIYTHRNTADGVRSAKGDDAQPGDTISSYMHVKVRICQFQRPQQICLLRRVNDASYLIFRRQRIYGRSRHIIELLGDDNVLRAPISPASYGPFSSSHRKSATHTLCTYVFGAGNAQVAYYESRRRAMR